MFLVRRSIARKEAHIMIGAAAIIAGNAGIMDHKMHQHYTSPAGTLTDQQIADLYWWAELHKQGIITSEEFAAIKTFVLGI